MASVSKFNALMYEVRSYLVVQAEFDYEARELVQKIDAVLDGKDLANAHGVMHALQVTPEDQERLRLLTSSYT